MRASSQDDVLRQYFLFAAVRELHQELTRSGQFAFAVDDFDVVLFHQETDTLGQPLADLPAAFIRSRIVELEVVEADAEFFCFGSQKICQFSIPQKCLGGDAADVQAYSTQVLALDDADFLAKLSGFDRCNVTARSCS